MSLQSMCRGQTASGPTTATIMRKSITQTASGGGNTVYTTAARGSLPTTTIGRFNDESKTRRFAYAKRDEEGAIRWFTTVNPLCDERDVLQLTGDDGVLQDFFVQGQQNPDRIGAFYVLILKFFRSNIQ